MGKVESDLLVCASQGREDIPREIETVEFQGWKSQVG